MNKIVTLSIVVSLLAPVIGFATEIYKTVDKDGRVTYTDRPTAASSEKVTIPEPIIVPTVIPKPRPAKPQEPVTPSGYTVQVSYPTPEMHINPGTFHLPVQVSTDPNVHPLHKLVVLDNGQAIDGMIIEYIIRGTHTIQAQVVDQQGKVLGKSDPVTVYVHRPTINSRNNIQPR